MNKEERTKFICDKCTWRGYDSNNQCPVCEEASIEVEEDTTETAGHEIGAIYALDENGHWIIQKEDDTTEDTRLISKFINWLNG